MGRVRQLEGDPTEMVGQKEGPSSNTTESVSSRSFNTTGKLPLLFPSCCGSKLSAADDDDDDMLLPLPPPPPRWLSCWKEKLGVKVPKGNKKESIITQPTLLLLCYVFLASSRPFFEETFQLKNKQSKGKKIILEIENSKIKNYNA